MSKDKNLKPGWRRVKFGDVVRQSKLKADPLTSGLERYVAGEHMDTDDLRIRRWGEIGAGYLGPAFHMHFKPGQVLYGSRRTYLRKVAVADFEGICANTTFVLESKDKDVLLPEFLPYLMQTEEFHSYSVKNSKGSVNPYINFSDLAEFEFALPEIASQLNLIQVINQLNEIVENYRHAVIVGGIAIQSFKDNIFSGTHDQYQKYSLEQLLLRSPESGCSAPPREGDTGYFVLGLSSLTQSGFRCVDYKPVDLTEKMAAAKLQMGDLLISRSNTIERVGFVGVFDDDRDNISFPDTMMRLKPNPALIEVRYLEALLQANSSRSFIMQIAAGTSASMKKINRTNLLKMKISIPSISVQNDFLVRLSELTMGVAKVENRYLMLKQLRVATASKFIGSFK